MNILSLEKVVSLPFVLPGLANYDNTQLFLLIFIDQYSKVLGKRSKFYLWFHFKSVSNGKEFQLGCIRVLH